MRPRTCRFGLVVRRSGGPLPSAGRIMMFSFPPLADLYVTLLPSGVQMARALRASDVSRVKVPRARSCSQMLPVSLPSRPRHACRRARSRIESRRATGSGSALHADRCDPPTRGSVRVRDDAPGRQSRDPDAGDAELSGADDRTCLRGRVRPLQTSANQRAPRAPVTARRERLNGTASTVSPRP